MHPREFDSSPAQPPEDPALATLRVPPHSMEAESGVLGGLLLDNGAWDRVGDLLVEGDFYRHEHRLTFGAIAALLIACKPADVVTVHEHLQRAGNLDAVGGLTYLNSLAQYVPSAANIRRYAEIVRERSILRKLLSASDEIATSAFNPQGADVETILDAAAGKLQALQLRGIRSMPVLVETLVVPLIDRVEALAEGRVRAGIPTRIPTLDRMLGGGIKPGKQIIVAARPSVGKSSFAQQICLNLARDGHACAFFSQEMGNDELADRAVANLGMLGLDRLATGKLLEDEWSRLSEGVEALRSMPLYFDEQAALSLSDIRSKARMLKRQHDVKVIVLDYLQLCAGAKAGDSRHHQLEELSRGIKNLAKELGLTFISLSQLNREVEKRTSGRPVLSDLKESGAIEEDADVVILLSRNGDQKTGPRQIVCDVPKNRQGRVGELGLIFDGEYQRWSESAEAFQFKTPPRKQYTEDV